QLMVIVNLIAIRGLTVLSAALPVWLVFRLLRKREVPALHPVELRWRALLILTLFVWSWVLVITQLALPAVVVYLAVYGNDAGLLTLSIYAGSIGLIVPAFLGALLGLPGTMSATRPPRLLLTSVVVTLASALAMVAVTYAMVHIGSIFDGFNPGHAFTAFVALVWFVASTLLCWLLVKALTRKQHSSMKPALEASV
ncbi:MAG: hypothetical protein WA777_11775, partial [Rhodanobacter sp.]